MSHLPVCRRSASVTESVYPGLKLVEGYVPESGFRWNVAIAVRKGDEDLRKAIEAVIKEELTSKQIEKICHKYHLSYYPPFDKEVTGRKSNAKIQN